MEWRNTSVVRDLRIGAPIEEGGGRLILPVRDGEAERRRLVVVGLVDVSKGAAAVAIAYWLLDLEPIYVYLAGGAAVAGHNWMFWLKFSGGKGMGASIGALAVLMPVYGYAVELGILLAILVVPLVTIRNVALAMGIGLIALPFIAWLMGEHSGMFVVWSVIVGLMVTSGTTIIPSIIPNSIA